MKAVVLLAVICCAKLFAQPLQEKIVSSDFWRADSVAALYPRHSLKDLRGLVDKLTRPLPTEEEKFRTIYRWITYNIGYDYGLYLKNKSVRERLKDPAALNAWNAAFSKTVFGELVNKQRTICSGYAYLLKEMASMAGLSCVIVDGYGRTAKSNVGGQGEANHSWNAVKLHNKWYLCDVTWSSGAIDTGAGKYVKRFDNSYFLADPSLFVRNHYPLDSAWMLLKNKPTITEFLERPLVYTGIYDYKIGQLLPETFTVTASKGDSVTFCFQKDVNQVGEEMELRISSGFSNYSIAHPVIQMNAGGFYCVDHVFEEKGEYVVNFLLNNSYLFAYKVKVRGR